MTSTSTLGLPNKHASEGRLSDITDIEQSPWFDAEWYMLQYPDVAVSGMSPAQHYLLLGEAWGRRAGPRFDAEYYLNSHPDVAKAGISPLLHFTRNGEKEGRWPVRLRANELEELLWQQTRTISQLSALERLLTHQDPWEASYAAWALGRWYAWQGEWQCCADILAHRYQLTDAKPATPAPRLLEIEALINTGQLVEAWRRIQQLEETFPNYLDTSLALSNVFAVQASAYARSSSKQAVALTEQLRLQHINTLFVSANLSPIMLKDDNQPLTLDNLISESPEAAYSAVINEKGWVNDEKDWANGEKSLVSIIMPVFNAEKHLETALHSLARQLYTDLEVIVVDDASTDNTLTIAQAFSQQDARFRVLAQPRNQGAYAARNRGLAASKGAFITVHDSDDWSHPQKIELQVKGLKTQPAWKACFSDWVRCSTELMFNRWRLEALDGWIYRNTSSFMFRREVFETLGFWDVVRVDADTEYFQRFTAAFGVKAFGGVKRGVPLAFGRSLPTSLSQAGPTHLVTQFKGVRCEYREAAAQWHAGADQPSDLYLSDNPKTRPFPSPAANLPG
ncbi:MAG: glycosyltransferase family 2 protein [Halomonadaceae bacterium]|uniref:Glycosyltransferase family 2 protein n=1 Tax=Halomonas colorata TaxID=2742615 RepID=A0ABR9G270_9GAMM|nr:glycosyltransferase family A protein [Halomonas colorata]MBE0465003.1 glycosyltransferase family 2 protein [Halomonas colorata]